MLRDLLAALGAPEASAQSRLTAVAGCAALLLLLLQRLRHSLLLLVLRHRELRWNEAMPSKGHSRGGPSPFVRILLVFFPSVLGAAAREQAAKGRVSALLLREGPAGGSAEGASASFGDMRRLDGALCLLAPALWLLEAPEPWGGLLRTAAKVALCYRVVAPAAVATRELIEDVLQIGHLDGVDARGFSHLSSGLGFSLWLVFALLTLQVAGVDTSDLLKGLGVGGIVVGFAVQSILSDFFAGLALLLDDWFRCGDLVEFEGDCATVEQVGLRSTRLSRLCDGELLYVPNSRIAAAPIVNQSRREERRVAKRIHLHVDTPPSKLREAVAALDAVLDRESIRSAVRRFGEAPNFGVNILDLDEHGFAVEFLYFIRDGQDAVKWKFTETEVHIGIAEALEAAGVRFGFPKVHLHPR